ncbi:hypothetical protein PTTG_05287, partial [Puccinia triticina 1-1 BBBD Race 1]
MEKADPALINFHEPATSRPSFGPPPNRSSLSVPSLQNIQENDDLINMSFEENPAPKPALVLPGPSNSGPSLLSTSAESISRAGSFPRTSLEPVLPRLSSICALPRLSSASPSRLSGSLSGSPKNLRLPFASPRRLVFPAGTSNQANQNDPGQNTNELLRSKSANPSASVKEAPLDLHRTSNPSHQQHDDPHPSGASSSMPSPQTLPELLRRQKSPGKSQRARPANLVDMVPRPPTDLGDHQRPDPVQCRRRHPRAVAGQTQGPCLRRAHPGKPDHGRPRLHPLIHPPK